MSASRAKGGDGGSIPPEGTTPTQKLVGINTPMRKYIDIINEFQMQDVEKLITTDSGDGLPPLPSDDDGEPGGKKVMISNILWDLSDEEITEYQLPTHVTTTLQAVEDAADPYADEEDRDNIMHKIGNWLTTHFHGNLSNFDYTII